MEPPHSPPSPVQDFSPLPSISPAAGGPTLFAHPLAPAAAEGSGLSLSQSSSPDDLSASLNVGEMHASSSFLAPGHDVSFLVEDEPAAASPSLFGDSPAWLHPIMSGAGHSKHIRHSMPAPPPHGMQQQQQQWVPSHAGADPRFAPPPAPESALTQSIQFPRHFASTPPLRAAGMQRAALESSLDGSLQPLPEGTSTRGHWDAPRAGLPLVHKPASPATPSNEAAQMDHTLNGEKVLREQLDEMEARCQSARQRESETAARLKDAEASLRDIKQNAEQQEAKLQAREEDLEAALDRLSATEELLLRKSQELEEVKSSLQVSETSFEAKNTRLQDVASEVRRELGDYKFREEVTQKQLTEAKEAAVNSNQLLQDSQRRIEAMESIEGKLHDQMDKQRSTISLLSARLTGAEMECSALKEALMDAASAKDGMAQAMARDRSELEDTRGDNRNLRRTVEDAPPAAAAAAAADKQRQENLILGLNAEIRRCKEECEQLQRRNIFLEGQTQALAARGSPVHLDFPDMRPPSREVPAAHGLDRNQYLPEPSGYLPEPARLGRNAAVRSSAPQGLQQEAKRLTQQELEVLDHMMRKVKAAKQGSGPLNMNNPPGLDPQERSMFKYLMARLEAGSSRPASPPAGYQDSTAGAKYLGQSHGPSAQSVERTQPPSGSPVPGNRPPPFATGAGYGAPVDMQKGHSEARGAPMDAYKRQDYVSSLPFGTEETLQESISNTQEIENRLMELNKEKTQLTAEFSRVPMNGGKTLAARERSTWVESRLETLQKDISKCKLELKRLGVR